MSKDKLLAAEQCKEMLRSQLLTATRELNESNAKVDEYLGAIKQLVNKEKQLELEKAELMQVSPLLPLTQSGLRLVLF